MVWGVGSWITGFDFAKLEMLGEMSYADKESKKRKITQNFVPKDSKDARILKELCASKTYKQTCKIVWVHVIASEGKKPRKVYNTLFSQLTEIILQELQVENRNRSNIMVWIWICQ